MPGMSACPLHRAAYSLVVIAGTYLALCGAQALVERRDERKNKLARSAPAELSSALVEPFLAERLAEGTKLALQAGAAMKKVITSAKSIEEKGRHDLVTETDKANEKLIFEGLRSKFPSDLFIGEETSADNGSIDALTDAPTWIVDPVDGTTNFVHSFPFTCVSIGFAREGTVVMGIIYDPCKDEMFQAVKGHGVWLNGKRMFSSQSTKMHDSLIITEYGSVRDEPAITSMMDATKAVLKKSRGLRQIGSGALDLAYVAVGRVDGVYSGVAGEGWKPWDYAAGLIMAQEGGAVMVHCDGSKFDVAGDSVLCCASQELKDEIQSVIAPFLTRKVAVTASV